MLNVEKGNTVISQVNLSLHETDENPSNLHAELQRLPTSLSESLEALEKNDVFKDLIGEKLLVAIKGIRKVCFEYASDVVL